MVVWMNDRLTQVTFWCMVTLQFLIATCPQQPLLIQTQTDIPARRLPVEGWIVEELRLYHRQLGRGRAHNTFKNFDTPTALSSPATPPSPLTATPEAIFFAYVTSNIRTYEIITTCIERTSLPCFGLIGCQFHGVWCPFTWYVWVEHALCMRSASWIHVWYDICEIVSLQECNGYIMENK